MKPGGTCCRRAKLRTSRPAPTSRITDSASSAMTTDCRVRAPRAPPAVTPPVAGPFRCAAGPGREPQRRQRAEEQARERRDREREEEHLSVQSDLVQPRDTAGAERADSGHAPDRQQDAEAPPPAASRRLSVSSCRTIRAAARAERGAHARSLSAAPARATAAGWRRWRRRSAARTPRPPRGPAAGRRTSPTTCSWSGTMLNVRPPFGG